MKINKKLTQAISILTTTLLLISHTPPVFSDSGIPSFEEALPTPDKETEEEQELTISTTKTQETSAIEEVSPSSNEETKEGLDTTTESLSNETEEIETESSIDTSESSESSEVSEESESSSTTESRSDEVAEETKSSSATEDSSSTEPSTESVLLESEPSASQDKVNPSPILNAYPRSQISIDAQLLAKEFVASDLNGFELPTLASYANQNQAAIVYASLKLLSEPYLADNQVGHGFDHYGFIQAIYNKVFGLSLDKTFAALQKIGDKVAVEEAQIGDLLIWEEDQKMAIYLGQNKFIMADEQLSNEKMQNTQTEENLEKIPGVRIFTLHTNQTNEEDGYDQDLLTRYDFMQTPSYAVQISPSLSLSAEGEKQLADYPASFHFQENEQTLAFIDVISESARELGLKYDLFASVLIAQAILESGSGTSSLAQAPYYNLFGIKGAFDRASVLLATQEDDGSGRLFTISSAFRVYDHYADSLADYVALIRNGLTSNTAFYQNVWRSNAKNYLQATSELTGKYATDTSYYNKLNSIIATYHLTQFDEPKVEVGNALQNIHQIPQVYREKMIFPEFNGQNYNTTASYGMDQCTWYVFNRVTQLGGKVGDYMGNGADWKESGEAQGYQTSNRPKAGYVISFKQGVAGYHPLYGHVAFVESVTSEGILISEGDASYLSYRVIPNEIALSSGVGYLIPN